MIRWLYRLDRLLYRLDRLLDRYMIRLLDRLDRLLYRWLDRLLYRWLDFSLFISASSAEILGDQFEHFLGLHFSESIFQLKFKSFKYFSEYFQHFSWNLLIIDFSWNDWFSM